MGQGAEGYGVEEGLAGRGGAGGRGQGVGVGGRGRGSV